MEKTFLLIAASIVFLCSCNLGTDNDPAIVSTVKPELKVDLHHPLNSPGDFAFLLSTLDKQCSDQQLTVSHLRFKTDLRMNVNGLTGPAECMSDYTILTHESDFYITPGLYSVTISIGESLTSTGILDFDGSIYRLDLPQREGISVGYRELHVIPEGLIWGKISSTTDLESVETALTNELAGIVTQPTLDAGYYGHFTIANPFEVQLNIESSTSGTSTFIYMLTGEKGQLQVAIDNIRDLFGNYAQISCMSWDGSVF